MTLDSGRVQAVFLAVIELKSPADRGVVLDRECADDAELRGRVEALLIAHDGAGSLLDRPFVGPIGGELSPPGRFPRIQN